MEDKIINSYLMLVIISEYSLDIGRIKKHP